MRYTLATLVKRANPRARRRAITFRDAVPPARLATNLYRNAYLPVVARWEAAIPSIIAEYERTLSALTTDTADDLQARLDAASTDLARLFIILDAQIRDWTVAVETWQRGAWRGAVLTATGVDLSTLIGPEDMRETLASYLRWNSELVRDVSAQTRQRISNAVFSGLQNRTPVREVAKQIREATGLARKRSLGIAADQLSKVTSALADERQRQAGITKIRWRSSHKKHARPWHAARDGKIFNIETRAPIDGGDPVPSGDWAGQAPFCGCRTQAYLELD